MTHDLDVQDLKRRIAETLRGRPIAKLPEHMDYDDLKAWKKAHMMLMADKLLEACQFALGALETMSTQQFAQGGDHCVRAHLHEAIVSAGGQATIADRTEIFQKAINDSIRHNIERLT